MKGVVFTVFLEMVEEEFSADMVDDILRDANPENGGAYTSVGTYSHEEIVALVVSLSQHSGIAVPDLLKAFGEYLFAQFALSYPQMISARADVFSFLSGIEDVIHSEVRKLYPDAQLPRFDIEHPAKGTMIMVYRSIRHFEDLCEGLIRGCIKHFGESISLSRITIGEGPGRAEQFELTRGA